MTKLSTTSLKLTLVGSMLIGLSLGLGFTWLGNHQPSSAQAIEAQQVKDLPWYSEADLARYNGQDANKPIYLAFEGYVYDVTAGSRFYDLNGNYHYLAGKDSTAELHVAGGGIIKRKYPIVGRLKP